MHALVFFLFFTLSLFATDWMDPFIAKEFAFFEEQKITQELLDATWDACKGKKEFKRFQIIDSKVYGDSCKIKRFLERLVQTYAVPNVDFIYFNEDRIKPSLFKRSAFKTAAPILVSAKKRGLNRVILFSDWMYDITEESGGWNQLIQTMLAHETLSWEDKKNVLFWRGTPWDGKHFGMYNFANWKTIPRGALVAQSMQHPDLINAAFSEYPDKCRCDVERCKKEMGQCHYIPWKEVIQHKYQMAIDGVTCSFPATQWKLLSGSVTFKQETDDIMYFYDQLKPWLHYIPVKKDLSDLLEKIQWAKTHDLQSKQIAENAKQFVKENLMPEHILLYCYKVLSKYAALQTFDPKLKTEASPNPAELVAPSG